MFRLSDTLSNVSLIYNNSQVYFCGEILSNLIKSACLIVINQIGKIVYLLYIIVKYTISHAFILSYVLLLVNSNKIIFVETKKLSNGDVEHVYEKVTTPAPTPTPVVEKSTTWVDENGNPLKPTEKGTLESGKIPGYEFVRTVVDENGNVRHIFRKVTKPAASVELKAQPKRLANTGTTETNTGLAGLGLAILGLAGIARRRKEK